MQEQPSTQQLNYTLECLRSVKLYLETGWSSCANFKVFIIFIIGVCLQGSRRGIHSVRLLVPLDRE